MYHKFIVETSVSAKMKQTGGFVSSMNNEQKNSYVKEQITKTLLLLLETKNIDDISISELTNAAEIGRVSFYRNYKSKEDILRQEAGRLLTQWGSIFQTMSSNDEYNSFFLSLFDFFQANKAFFTTLYQSGLSHIIMDTIVATAEISPQTQNLEAYLKSFWAYGVYGWIIEWIKRGMQESSQELLKLFKNAQGNTI